MSRWIDLGAAFLTGVLIGLLVAVYFARKPTARLVPVEVPSLKCMHRLQAIEQHLEGLWSNY